VVYLNHRADLGQDSLVRIVFVVLDCYQVPLAATHQFTPPGRICLDEWS